MASIKGFSLKNVHTMVGRDGQDISADMYFNGKKVGTYRDYGCGGEADAFFYDLKEKANVFTAIGEWCKNKVDKWSDNFYKTAPERFEQKKGILLDMYPQLNADEITTGNIIFFSVDILVENLLNLLKMEKHYKKAVKSGYKGIGIVEANDYEYSIHCLSATPADGLYDKVYMNAEDFNI